ncbi:hypothetical protein ACLOJK_022073 [Asimina triloba]
MGFTVIRKAHSIIRPIQSTPSIMLDLSVIDSIPAIQCKVRTLHVFRHGSDASSVIKIALSKALAHYYPLAGRLVQSGPGLLRVDCTGEGVWFVEAAADCSLDAVDYLDNDLSDKRFDLLPDPPSDRDGFDPMVMMQVTQFVGEGFVVGLEFSHAMSDGLGSAQFLNAVGELARGLDKPSAAPVWLREALPPSPKPARALLESKPAPPSYKLEQMNVDLSLDYVDRLKREFLAQTGGTCSAFEAIAASVWRFRTRAAAAALEAEADVRLVFFANVRELVNPPLPQGYYGNCFFPVNVNVSSRWLAAATNADVVRLIQEGKAKLPAEFGQWMAGDYVGHAADPWAPPLSYSTLFVSEWARLGFRTVNFGWGPPINFIPIQQSNIIPVCVLGSPTLPAKGLRLMTWCLEEDHLGAFHDQFTRIGPSLWCLHFAYGMIEARKSSNDMLLQGRDFIITYKQPYKAGESCTPLTETPLISGVLYEYESCANDCNIDRRQKKLSFFRSCALANLLSSPFRTFSHRPPLIVLPSSSSPHRPPVVLESGVILTIVVESGLSSSSHHPPPMPFSLSLSNQASRRAPLPRSPLRHPLLPAAPPSASHPSASPPPSLVLLSSTSISALHQRPSVLPCLASPLSPISVLPCGPASSPLSSSSSPASPFLSSTSHYLSIASPFPIPVPPLPLHYLSLPLPYQFQHHHCNST